MEVAMKSEPEIEKDSRDAFDNSFAIPLPPAEAWPLLVDIRRIASCMPGAELTEVVDDRTYKGKLSVPLGPVAFAFDGVMKVEEVNPDEHTTRVTARGADTEQNGGANATASFRLEPDSSGSKVFMHMDVALSGGAAQYARSAGLIEATATRLMTQFAKNLRAQIAKSPGG